MKNIVMEGIVRLMSLNSNSDLKLAHNYNVRKKLSVYILAQTAYATRLFVVSFLLEKL